MYRASSRIALTLYIGICRSGLIRKFKVRSAFGCLKGRIIVGSVRSSTKERPVRELMRLSAESGGILMRG